MNLFQRWRHGREHLACLRWLFVQAAVERVMGREEAAEGRRRQRKTERVSVLSGRGCRP